MMDQYVPKHVEVRAFYYILLNLRQLCAFEGLNYS
jgi:hypothetical protein